ncbi:unnamed protein product [Paramecium pentaurelia]|uniref:Serine hydrolase domain-containing protein n=1 Tax=Paramecium pentaurelia TaxID=43138 RepID=A0A8S1X1W7_9CILI|nr:unnamed protein product [Paramecium pentaurelia]
MDFNDLIFPCPKPSYNETLGGLYYIDEQICGQSIKNSNELKIQNGTLRVTISQNQTHHKVTKRRRIVTLLQLEQKLNKGIIVFFHANAEDLGMCKSLAFLLGTDLDMASISIEYPGYGIYKGNCSSDIMIKDGYQVMEHIIKVLKVQEENIIIIGRSIGCSIAIEMSIRYKKIRSLILLSAFTSICDVIQENSFFWISKLVKERFRNLEKMHKVVCPTLFIHGKDDDLVNYKHSIELMKECQGLVHIELFEGMNHNQFSVELHIISPIKQFLMKIK